MLVDRRGQTVTREEMVSAVWKDYGGGDEGLTQAISTLRRYLSDTGKELIQTIPKKGYSFKGAVAFNVADRGGAHTATGRSMRSKRIMITATGFAITILFALFLIISSDNKKQTPLPAETAFPGLQPGIDSVTENEANTIISVSPDSTVYKLTVIGDEPPRFYINGSRIPVDQWEPYQELVNHLKRELNKRQGLK